MSPNTLASSPRRHRGAALAGHVSRPAPSDLPALVSVDGPVVPLRRRAAIALGGLGGRIGAGGRSLVMVHDLTGAAWWIPTGAVWSDSGRTRQRPEVPQPIGLSSSASSAEEALLAGLSDRLGWEALHAFEGGADLPVLDTSIARNGTVVLDGRLAHNVPTVVVLGEHVLRWGAGSTWERALQRAMYRTSNGPTPAAELDRIAVTLEGVGVTVASVDMGTALLRRAGVFRRSVQLVAGSDDAGRAWDANRVH
jgi:hypothetical protein